MCLLLAGVFAWGLHRLTATVPYRSADRSSPAERETLLRVDPNTAQWWELTIIPGVGEVTAKKIIEYRDTVRREKGLPEDAPVFRSAADLQRVKGIGPKKSAAAEPYLTFSQPGRPSDGTRTPPVPQ
jgi:DNA uptake protein ComE-like DNA-binding protein